MIKVAPFLVLLLVPPAIADCPAGSFFDSAFNLCFKYFSTPASFPLAEKSCENLGGTLVSIQTSLENSYLALVAQASNSTSPDFWIGANLLLATNWQWTTGSNVAYSNWASDQPVDPSMYLCAALRQTDNAWTKNLCYSAKTYMCQIAPNVTPAGGSCSTPTNIPVTMATTNKPQTTTAAPPGCPDGYCGVNYTLNPDACKCYRAYYGQNYLRSDATVICQAQGARLPIIRNPAENNWIVDFLKYGNGTSNVSPWIDLICSTNYFDSCYWSDGSSTCYMNLGICEYNAGNQVYLDHGSKLWYVAQSNSNTMSGFLCEKDATPSLIGAISQPDLPDCPSGSYYDSGFGKCFKFFQAADSFPLAEKNCERIGGSLVMAQNVFENAYISGVADASNSTGVDFWIGANLLMANNWKWTSGINVSYSNFANGQPSDPSMYQCAALRKSDNMWTKNLCSTQKSYMCQVDPDITPVGNNCPTTTTSNPMTVVTTNKPQVTTPAPAGCPKGTCDPGYTLNKDACKCYKLYSDDSYTYFGANTTCLTSNGTLAIIRNAAENLWLTKFVKNASSSSSIQPWIGLWCPYSTNNLADCLWSDGSKACYTAFTFGSCTSYGSGVILHETSGSWSTNHYATTGGFICQKPGIPAGSAAEFPAGHLPHIKQAVLKAT